MIEIDGSTYSGSGTLLRYAVALSTLIGEPIHMYRIRARRDKPGLRPQHLEAIRACSSLASGRLEGDEVGSSEIYYQPGSRIAGGSYSWDIGTAGSTTMLAFAVIPPALFAEKPSRFTVTGGLFQDFAPSAFHMQEVLFQAIRPMGAQVSLEIERPGYVPMGAGRITVSVRPMTGPLRSLHMLEQGTVRSMRAISLASHLEKEKVSERMANRCRDLLEELGYSPEITIQNDESAVQRGAALLAWAQTSTGCLLGADQAGKRGRRSENIAGFVVRALMEDLKSGATTDRHLADQLILFAALASGETSYTAPEITDHILSNLWLVEKILGAKTTMEGNSLRIGGIGFRPPAR